MSTRPNNRQRDSPNQKRCLCFWYDRFIPDVDAWTGRTPLPVYHQAEVAVYPSILQMKRLALQACDRVTMVGNRRMRRIGHSYEFDQIKSYVPGDDYRGLGLIQGQNANLSGRRWQNIKMKCIWQRHTQRPRGQHTHSNNNKIKCGLTAKLKHQRVPVGHE